MNKDGSDKLLRPKEVADWLGLRVSTIRSWILHRIPRGKRLAVRVRCLAPPNTPPLILERGEGHEIDGLAGLEWRQQRQSSDAQDAAPFALHVKGAIRWVR